MRLPRIACRSLIPWTCALLGAVIISLAGGPATAAPLFVEVSETTLGETGFPPTSRFFALELAEVRAVLDGAPDESFVAPAPGLTLSLPLPDGTSERFSVWESSILHPELAAKYPEIKTYVGRGLDDRTATVRLDTTPAGFHAMILSTRRTMFIDPVRRGDTRYYASYFKRNRADGISGPRDGFTCELDADPAVVEELRRLMASRAASRAAGATGTELRTYRAAVAATGEYTIFHGGTVALGLAAITTSMNRVTGIYEREIAVRMELIANNNLIVYTNPATDPYSNSNGFTMLSQNQSNLDTVIGSANYDIGHVFSTGGGGVAGLAVVCRNGQKARGVTGLNSPIGDFFDVDYVAHEIGHQYGGNHSFNGTAGSCAGGNRNAATAYEPGSGSTIMAYAGICGSQNLQSHSDDYFHGISFDEMTAYTQSGLGNGCPVITATGNNPPVPVAGNSGLTIPKETPFLLEGSATDPEGDAMTYCWEEFDRGPAGDPNNPSGNAPIFRSFKPKGQPARMFPKPPNVRNNTQTIGEILPTYSRTLVFRFTVRDNLGGVDFDVTSVDVDANSGPFLVTSTGPAIWDAGSFQTITWDVAGTDAAPVSCSTVDILLSTDGAFSFPTVLAAGTPNDGSEVILVPNVETTEARVRVEAADNVFFDLNNDNFTIAGATGVEDLAAASPALELDVRPNPFGNRASIAYSLSRPSPLTIDVFDTAGRRVGTLFDGVRDAGTHIVEWNGRDLSGSRVAAGVYFVRMESQEGTRMARLVHLR